MLRKVVHILSPVAAVWLLIVALATVVCGVDDLDQARLLAAARPDNVRSLRVERLSLISEAPEVWQVEGRLADEARRRSLRIEPEDAALLVELGGRLPVIETGDAGEPLVTERWYESQPILRIGGVVLPLHLVFGVLVATIAALLLKRGTGREVAPTQALVETEAPAPALASEDVRRIASLERRAARDLAAFRRRVACVAALGLVFVSGVFLLFAGTAVVGIQLALGGSGAPSLTIMMLLAVGAIAMVPILRASAHAPAGEPIDRERAAPLFARLDSIADRLGGPRLDRVVVTEAFNAAIVPRPRFVPLARPRDHLLVGLPLMQALTVGQFEAVLAHEYGHLANAEARFACRIHRMRAFWLRLAGTMEGRWRALGFVFRPFLAWYAPWFSAHAVVLARHNELAADRLAAEATSPRTMIDALAVVAVRGRQLEAAFWPNLYDGARFQPDPPAAYRALGVAMKESLAPDAAAAHLDAALERRTGAGDSHPALVDRARALGQRITLPEAPVESAAEALLPSALEDLLDRFDARWVERSGDAWRETFERSARERALLAELVSAAAGGALSLEHRWCRARLTEEIADGLGAELMYREILADAPEHAPSHFALARLLLARDDGTGFVHLDRAMALDAEAVVSGCELAILHLERLDRGAEAEPYRVRQAAARRVGAEAAAERAGIGLDDELLSPAPVVEPAAIASIRAVVAAEPAIADAWLVRKALRHERGYPFLIVIVRAAASPDPAMQERLSLALARLNLLAEFWILPDIAANASICGRARAVAHSAIFTRPQATARS